MATATRNQGDRRTAQTHNLDEMQFLNAQQWDPGFVKAVESELDRLSRLAKNWDQEGAPPLDKKIIEAARRFIRALPENLAYRPHVVPMSPGNLQFEWHYGEKTLELEFETPETIHFLQWQPEAGIEEEATFATTNLDKAIDLIQWFMSGTLA